MDSVDDRECWRPYLGGNVISLCTTGDGACSIHGLVGVPDGLQVLTHPNPRGWINSILLGAGSFADVATLCATAGQEQVWTNVTASIGNELLLPWIRGDQSNESACFMQSLQRSKPELCQEAGHAQQARAIK